MKFIIATLLFIFTTTTLADVFEVKELYLVHKKFGPNSRNPLIDDNGLENRELDREIGLAWNIDIFKYGYFNNYIMSYVDRFKDSGDSDQFRLIGWNFQIGIRPFKFLWLEYEHFSKHQLDNKVDNRFPVEDSFNVKINFIDEYHGRGIF